MASSGDGVEARLAAAPPFEEVATPELAALLVRAKAFAQARGHEDVVIEHVALAILVDPISSELLRLSGVDVDTARFLLARELERPTTPLDWNTIYDGVAKVARLVAVATKRPLTTTDLLLIVLQVNRGYARAILVDHGLTALGLREVLAHGSAHVDDAAALPIAIVHKGALAAKRSASRYEVVIHNDDFTPLSLVVKILRSLFALSEADATALAQLVNDRGSAAVGVYPLPVALKKVDKATQLARAVGYPFKLSLRPVDE